MVCTKANPIGITKRLMRMIIYEAFRGLYELTVYVSKTNKGQTRPTQTAPPPPKKYLATQVASSFPASFLAHTSCFFVFSTFNCKNSRLFSAHSLKLFFLLSCQALDTAKTFSVCYHLRRCRAICA